MHIKNELAAMAGRMFDGDLLDKVLSAYKQEMRDDGLDVTEKEYDEGEQALSAVLNDEQKRALSEMETLCADNVKYALGFGFTRGVFVGFQQFFVEDTTKKPFEEFVADQILKQPHMNQYGEYSRRRDRFNEINATLEEQLDEANREHLTSVYCGWEGRLYGVLRHAFYMGYRSALSLIEEIGPIGATYRIIEKTLMTEYELGFTSTAEERERRQAGLARKKIQQPQVQE